MSGTMVRRLSAMVGLLATVAVLTGQGVTQSPPTAPKSQPPPRTTPKSEASPWVEDSSKDPTKPTPKIQEVLPKGETSRSGADGTGGFPKITLKGRLIGPTAPPAALLDVDGVIRLVRAGSRLPVPGGASVHVIEVSATEVTLVVEINGDKQTLSLQ
ncbi:MAG: hypothetical protein NZ700_16545 [Gemmataceae bacterium]|nr:hypothetical protein [Gemmataceae bacterium]MDW8264948.1 hypothetical protein [Gemmataceae bacterium]